MSDHGTLVAQAVAHAETMHDIETLQVEVRALRLQVESLRNDRDKALIYGVYTLGALVLALVGWVVNLFATGKIRP